MAMRPAWVHANVQALSHSSYIFDEPESRHLLQFAICLGDSGNGCSKTCSSLIVSDFNLTNERLSVTNSVHFLRLPAPARTPSDNMNAETDVRQSLHASRCSLPVPLAALRLISRDRSRRVGF
eukprot:6190581-Pleurochrysis_carterae.AAC.1